MPGKFPGSAVGSSAVDSWDTCMGNCESTEGCMSVLYLSSSDMCYLLDRSYDSNFVTSTNNFVANYGPGITCGKLFLLPHDNHF